MGEGNFVRVLFFVYCDHPPRLSIFSSTTIISQKCIITGIMIDTL